MHFNLLGLAAISLATLALAAPIDKDAVLEMREPLSAEAKREASFQYDSGASRSITGDPLDDGRIGQGSRRPGLHSAVAKMEAGVESLANNVQKVPSVGGPPHNDPGQNPCDPDYAVGCTGSREEREPLSKREARIQDLTGETLNARSSGDGPVIHGRSDDHNCDFDNVLSCLGTPHKTNPPSEREASIQDLPGEILNARSLGGGPITDGRPGGSSPYCDYDDVIGCPGVKEKREPLSEREASIQYLPGETLNARALGDGPVVHGSDPYCDQYDEIGCPGVKEKREPLSEREASIQYLPGETLQASTGDGANRASAGGPGPNTPYKHPKPSKPNPFCDPDDDSFGGGC
ncbi:Hypothetical predicted protein [Lecanosticta acicola]|uniref:Uncharacterized protein n=1 Tax=Lecanosticta acicola TaxID=111012 RepID=A0AAI9E885_9PEZI|nr:Hypothetical predicted protein [Lecanosticta acicola]